MNDYTLEEMLFRIKEIKKINKITNEMLSKKTKISLGTLSKILAGVTKEPSIQSIIKIANALNVSADYLITGEESTTECAVNLTKRENLLLSDFRNLSEQGQDYILQTMDMVKDKYKKDIHSSDVEDVG